MPIKGIILVFMVAIIIAWFAKDEICSWFKNNLKNNTDEKENEENE